MSMRWTVGSCMSWGREARTPLMALRTSLVARSVSVPSSNSMVVEETPSVIWELMWRTPDRPASESSISRVT
ncbi:hypothetical protein D3C85_1249670 [compost metagenome]